MKSIHFGTKRTGKERGDEILRELKRGSDGRLRREVGDLKGLIDRRRAGAPRLRENKKKLIGECERRDDWTVKLDHKNTDLRVSLNLLEASGHPTNSIDARTVGANRRPGQTAYPR